jgi:hypothetical protein
VAVVVDSHLHQVHITEALAASEVVATVEEEERRRRAVLLAQKGAMVLLIRAVAVAPQANKFRLQQIQPVVQVDQVWLFFATQSQTQLS